MSEIVARLCSKCGLLNPTSSTYCRVCMRAYEKELRAGTAGKNKPCKECGEPTGGRSQYCAVCREASRERTCKCGVVWKDASKRNSNKCPDCWATYMRDYDRKPERSIAKREKKYGLAPGQYQEMAEAQEYRCLICKKHATEDRYGFLSVDHDHACCSGTKACGKCVRGLICSDCNQLLGHAKDNVSTLLSAASYLTKFTNVLADISN